MKKSDFDVKQGIKAHLIKTDLFKTNMIAVTVVVPLLRETVTKNALIVSMLRRGSNNFKSQTEISKELENLYGAGFECGIDKYGDNQILRFYIDSINDKFALEKDEILKKSIKILLDIVFNPLMENGKFSENYFKLEKENLSKIIKGKIDNKDSYAYNQCISEMYKEEGFGLYKYGYEEDLEKITIDELSDYYLNLIQNSKIDVYVSGEFDENYVREILINDENIKKLVPRIENYKLNNEYTECKENVEKVNEIKEELDVVQGKIVIRNGYTFKS